MYYISNKRFCALFQFYQYFISTLQHLYLLSYFPLIYSTGWLYIISVPMHLCLSTYCTSASDHLTNNHITPIFLDLRLSQGKFFFSCSSLSCKLSGTLTCASAMRTAHSTRCNLVGIRKGIPTIETKLKLTELKAVVKPFSLVALWFDTIPATNQFTECIGCLFLIKVEISQLGVQSFRFAPWPSRHVSSTVALDYPLLCVEIRQAETETQQESGIIQSSASRSMLTSQNTGD